MSKNEFDAAQYKQGQQQGRERLGEDGGVSLYVVGEGETYPFLQVGTEPVDSSFALHHQKKISASSGRCYQDTGLGHAVEGHDVLRRPWTKAEAFDGDFRSDWRAIGQE